MHWLSIDSRLVFSVGILSLTVLAIKILMLDIKNYAVNYWVYLAYLLGVVGFNILYPEEFLELVFSLYPYTRWVYLGLVIFLVAGFLVLFYFYDPDFGIFKKIAMADLLMILTFVFSSPFRGSLALAISGIVGIIVWGVVKKEVRVPFVGVFSIIMLMVLVVDIGQRFIIRI